MPSPFQSLVTTLKDAHKITCLKWWLNCICHLEVWNYIMCGCLSCKALSCQFFIWLQDTVVSFPLYHEALKFSHHREKMIQTAIRALTLSIYNGMVLFTVSFVPPYLLLEEQHDILNWSIFLVIWISILWLCS